LDVTRTITRVIRDWDPAAPANTSDIIVAGRTLAEVEVALNRLSEWGQGGGRLRTDRVPVGTSPEVTVTLHANLELRMPRWTGYAQASAGAKAEWDRMSRKLRIHEERHLAIAVEEAAALADALIGVEISSIAQMVTDANRTMQGRQDQLDTDTDHGSKPGVQYGDVILDVSIT
jgi:hypothetical protein